jgi:centrosome and spindle pole-associated protein 1
MREAQMRKIQSKQEKDEYEKKLEADINKYNYFGRSGGGAPMRDKDGNVVANLADLRNPQQQTPRTQLPSYAPFDDKTFSLGAGTSSILNAPFYNGEQPQQQYPSDTVK